MTFKLETPQPEPASPGLLSVITTQDGQGHVLYEEAQYDVPLDAKLRDVPEEGVEKTFERRAAVNETVLFKAYLGFDEPLLLQTEVSAELQAAYDRNEDWAVERRIQQLVLNPKAVDLTPTPGTPVTSPKLAHGLLEQYARDTSSFKPLITGNALALALTQDFVKGDAPELQATILGTPIRLAGGYGTTGPGGAVAPAGSAWLYITGQIRVWRVKGLQDAIDYRNNRSEALAEGSYAASVDSFVAAVLVGTN